MLALHAALGDSGRLLLWGELEGGAVATVAGVREALAAEGLEIAGSGGTAVAWLPVVNGKVVSSSPLLVGEVGAAGRRKPKIAAWPLEVLAIAGADALELLVGAVGKRLLAPGVLVAADLAFCVTVMRFAATLVARQRFLPGLAGGRAVWQPAYTAVDLQQLAALGRSVPPSALAVSATEGPPRGTPQNAVGGLVGMLTDALVRRAIGRGTPDRGGRETPALHDRWLAALRSTEGALRADPAEIAKLEASWQEWARPVTAGSALPFRLGFRLEEPEAGDDDHIASDAPWYLRYLLQSIDDPSLLLPASLIWGEGKSAKREERRALQALLGAGDGAAAREHLLRSLGQASALSRTVERSLRGRAPAEAVLDAAAAFAFLQEEATALESAGFAVFLPSWWGRRGTRQRLAVRGTARPSKFKSESGLSLQSIVKVDWSVAVGDQTLTGSELAALAKVKAPLVRLRGQWVQISSAEIAEALRYWKKKGAAADSMTLRELVRLRVAGPADAGLLPVAAVEGEGPLGELLGRLEGSKEWKELPAPAGFSGTLRPYQARGFSWLDFLKDAGLGACLADDMGLGKTVQTLALLQKDWLLRREPVLLICPTSVTGNWVREAARFTPHLPVLLHHGTARMRGADFAALAGQQALVVSSYALLHRELERLKAVPWKGVILDEAQNIKNAEAKQSQAARALPADYRIALTGTPVENNVGDLWSIMEFLNPGFLGTHRSFRERFFLPIQTRRDPEATAQLKRLTSPFILRRLKSDKSIISDLPEKNEMKVFCTLTREQASLYQAVVNDAEAALQKAEGIARKGVVLATLTRLKQVCNHPGQFLKESAPAGRRSGKLNRLTEMLSEAVEEGDRSLVFTQFAEMGTILQRHLQENLGREALFLHGGTSRTMRDTMVERFQNEEDGPPIFILSLKAGGTGLNLTRANHVFHFDRWWNPAVENQATDRAFRIGQKKNVQVHKYVCGGTVEERIDELIEGKSALAASIVGTGEGWLTELSNHDLRELFALRADAVGES
ncbi:MAG: Helicase, family [Acidobacteria bacterium]|nr:Helicase, family [Acidobacteriota bacterium]